jgi:hypothetical protein
MEPVAELRLVLKAIHQMKLDRAKSRAHFSQARPGRENPVTAAQDPLKTQRVMKKIRELLQG